MRKRQDMVVPAAVVDIMYDYLATRGGYTRQSWTYTLDDLAFQAKLIRLALAGELDRDALWMRGLTDNELRSVATFLDDAAKKSPVQHAFVQASDLLYQITGRFASSAHRARELSAMAEDAHQLAAGDPTYHWEWMTGLSAVQRRKVVSLLEQAAEEYARRAAT